MSSTATPEIVTTDVARYSAGAAEAIVQRPELTDTGEVRFDFWTSYADGIEWGSVQNMAAVRNFASVIVQAANETDRVRVAHGTA